MTIETKMLKPVKGMNFERIGSIVSKYNKLSDLLDGTYINDLILETMNMDNFSLRYACENDDLKSHIQTAIEHELESLESQLNILGYTMQDEPKEWQYHVNILRGEDDN